MKVIYKEHPRTIGIRSNTHTLCIRQLSGAKAKQSPAVAVEIANNNIVTREAGFKSLVNREVHGCLGLITVEKQVFVAIITGAITNVASPVNYETIDKIYSVDFISLSSDEWDFANLDPNGYSVETENNDDFEARNVHPCHELKKLLSNGSFYYSNDFDLTSLLQNRGLHSEKLAHNLKHDGNINLDHYRQEYMWNSFMMEELIKFRSNLDTYAQNVVNENKFLTTVIRGFAKTTTFSSSGAAITIISKQSWKRAGTRFNARGIDDNGNVANFVETEFVYDNPSQHLIFAFTQIRGSVPTFWEQDSTLINPKITLTRSLGATQPIFDKHFDDICGNYGVCHIVNLLSKTKPAEVQVSRRYKELYLNSSHRDNIAFSDFDFHAETKPLTGGFAGATKILPMLHQSMEQFGWFTYDTDAGEVVTRQDGVFRVNCLDCLDRTNLIQQVICQSVLECMFKNYLQNDNHRDRMALEETINKHNGLWADNGDAISQIYTGTNALKSSFSRSGKMNFAGALSDVTKSVSRMYQNTFVDSKKQSTMDLLLGYDAQSSTPVRIYDPINEYVNDKLEKLSSTFTSWDRIIIFVGTFNVNATSPHPSMNLTDWLFPPENLDNGLPDIYAIGLQELIELNAGSILTADASKPLKWAQLIEEQLNSQKEQYLLLRTEAIASMCMFLFVKKSQVHNVTQVSGSSKKTGLGGMAANKGGCAVRFEYGLTSFALVTSHLAAGTTAVLERYNDYQTIIRGLTFTRNHTIRDHDHVLWFGDLNYRISMPNDRCRYLIESGAFDELSKVDQLADELGNSKDGAFRGFKEGKVKFYPTYKFDKGTSNYDTSEKQRVPSWTDRVLYMTKNEEENEIHQLNYNSLMNIELSDHKPVFSTFNSKVKFIDKEKRDNLASDLYNKYKAEHGGGNEISLVEIPGNRKSSSPASFSAETLSEMNLLDDENIPRLPTRPVTLQSLPKRIPPPPNSRKTYSSDKSTSSQTTHARKLPPPPEFDNLGIVKTPMNRGSSPVAPPPARKTVVPIGFSSTPLIPSGANTPNALSPASTNSNFSNIGSRSSSTANLSAYSAPTPSTNGTKKPLVPSKPTALAGNKTHVDPPSPTESSSSAEVANKPTPPPPRTSKTMSEWKPLIPQ